MAPRRTRAWFRIAGLLALLAVGALAFAEATHGHLVRGRDDAGCVVCSAAHASAPSPTQHLVLAPPPRACLLDPASLVPLVDGAARRPALSRGPPPRLATI